ncbi:hypothetical protein BT93_H1052 [Corymbia citriodora subsp. variegata]|nr:hypothetical protein BT93_H1052 [Corymbia citriodora subsp. variegata]
MRGIFAYLNCSVGRERSDIIQVLFNGLRRLEYRGYDSTGISVDASSVSLPPLASEVDATDLNLEESFLTHARIAHTRWATHGEPAPRNSHPRGSGAENEFLVVHNGVITNHEVLKQTLIRLGFTFESDTNTEVIPKLAKYVFDKSNEDSGDMTMTFSRVVPEVMRHLEGAYALIFKSQHYPNELIACKHGSPLLLGVKKLTEESSKDSLFHDDKYPSQNGNPRELFLSSDANALVEHTREDGGVSILKFDGDKGKCGVLSRPASVQCALSVLKMEIEQINKGNYKHYMQKEIHEQPESLTTTMRGQTYTRSQRIVFIGCGPSYDAAVAARPILEELSGNDLLDHQGPIYREDTAVFVGQSGETADTLHALEYALQNGALCVGITNTFDSAIARNTHCGVHINAGAEIGVASTKAYTSQIVVMAMLAFASGGDTTFNEARREAIIDYKVMLKLDQEMKDLVKLLIAEQSILMFGRGYDYATALEGSLKVKEVALMHSEGILAGEMKHGPLALVDEILPIVVIATHDACFSKQQSVIQQLRACKGRLTVIVIEVPQVEGCLQPVVNIVPLQLLAYHLTVLRGYNVYQPRNLANSMTTK